MLATDLTLYPDEFVTPRDWGEGVGAIGGPLRMKIAVRNAGTASVAGFHSFGGSSRSSASLLENFSYHPARLLAGGLD